MSDESIRLDQAANTRDYLLGASIRRAIALRVPANPVFPANGLDPGNEKVEAGTLTLRGTGCQGHFEIASKESVKVDQRCQGVFPAIEPRGIPLAYETEQSITAGIAKAILIGPRSSIALIR